MTERQGAFTLPTRLYLTEERRAKLEQLLRAQQVDLADWLSQFVADHLDTLPDAPPSPTKDAAEDRVAALRQRRAELTRLRNRRDIEGPRAPDWLHEYIAELEAEVRKLEGGSS